MHLILLSDMLLMTVEREGRYLLRETREVTPVVKINNITDIRGETNGELVVLMHFFWGGGEGY